MLRAVSDPHIMAVMPASYDSCSFAALTQLLAEHGGDLIALFPVAFITSRPRSDGLRLDRQHVTVTGSGRLLIESAYDASSSNGLHRKVYWNALEPTAAGVRLEELDRGTRRGRQ